MSTTGVKTLSEMRDRLELMMSIQSGSAYVDSTPELDDLNEGYQATANAHDWPSLLTRVGIVLTANLNRYALPTNLRKVRTAVLNGILLREVEQEYIKKSRNAYVVDQVQGDIIVSPIPASASTAYALTNSPSAASAASVTFSSVSGLSQYDEVWIDSASGTDEFTTINSISGTTALMRLITSKSSGDILYRQQEILDILGYKFPTLLANSGDKTVLPGALDFIIPMKSASIAYKRLEMFDEADKWEKTWRDAMDEAWLAIDKNSTGEATSFSL